MEKRIKRHSLQARITHAVFGISCILLAISGLFVFIPALAEALPSQVTFVIRMMHRVLGIVFVIAPLVSAAMSPGGMKHFFGKYLKKWDKNDVEWIIKFVPYMLFPKKVHMPDQREVKSGQVVADGALIVGSFFIAISGIVLLVGTSFLEFPSTVMLVARLIHDISFLWLCIFGLAHIYLGAGIFQPYRRTLRTMYGDGTVGESDALYHWGTWAREELESGKNVVEVEEDKKK